MPESFLKWPGGKRWLVNRYSALFPAQYQRYLEPFLGGGAVFFHLKAERAVLSDTNEELINAFQRLKQDSKTIEARLPPAPKP